MKKLFTALVVLLVGIVGVIFVARYATGGNADRGHFERGETELVIVNQTSAPLRLFKAGKSLAESTLVPAFDGNLLWLPAGNYFLQAEQAGKQTFYPLPVLGFRQGPEKGGELSVTVRAMAAGLPPRLLPTAPEFVVIPSGHFLYGDRTNPQETHYVWQQAFFISSFEVTNEEFKVFLSDPNGYRNNAHWTEDGKRWKAENKSSNSALLQATDADFKRFGQADQPVVNVNWFEAVAYCHWLTNKIGANKWIYALPSEAEWEKATRGPDNFDYSLGMNLSDAEVKTYNWKKNPSAEVTVVGWRDTTTNYQPNRYGIFHATGNVAEWTSSLQRQANREYPYADDDRNRESFGGARVVRGGSWYSASTATMYISYRETFEPSVHTPYLGFRVVARVIP
ncbi:MAG TPA: SUMF1/EgtB/PvdO family nonheme iron enzyme [Blastocatellia bacterium]|nr:SUMF1/EgtB/PvdO family nonheme iron enzyme [Blastocatellia bacterium]